jgi:oxepin-CoA hydrolase/3-oxo-5,6-dehydrosuberyl-CoA semialdehyde dehydrogenase
MKTLRSHVGGAWHESTDGARPLYNPSTEEAIAQASTAGIDFGAALEFAQTRGGAALSELTFAQRGELLKGMSKALYEKRDELIDLSIENTGTTRRDSKFDLDGATGTLHYYALLGAGLGDRKILVDGEGDKLGRSARFWGQHVRVPRRGAAVLINAFNFPAWGFAEKAAAAILGGMPVICKPATSTALVTERCIEIVVEAGLLPEGVVSLIAGSTGDLLERLGPQDVLSFTGSADTAFKLRSMENLLRNSVAVNIEADSLNAAVLGPDVEPGSETWGLFLRDVIREMTQKTGQKCTAVRRVFVPQERADDVQAELIERLGDVVTGNPTDASVTMGPVTTPDQFKDDIDGVKKLAGAAQIVHGSGERVDGVGAEPGKGYFFGPTLLRADDARGAAVIHEDEVFGPVATLLPFDGSAGEAADLVGLSKGTLVTSLYSDDDAYVGTFLTQGGGAQTGRLYLGSEKMAEQAPGSGVALPQSLHGGPGRAGGGEELGALRALNLYTQRVALQGSRKMLQGLIGAGGSD